ncbi:MAG TPA: hypothetical protein VEQ59_15015 [Polyangiaceae bacterium]|nr:hypothetical protein [Polyangiaceae bacterium]
MAKLVPATCPQCGGNVQLDPEREFVTCQFCGASSFVQTQKRHVTAYVQAQHLPVIQLPASRGGLGVGGIIAIVAGVLGVFGAVAGLAVAYFATTAVTKAIPGVVAAPGFGNAGNTTPLVEEDYYADATLALARYQKVLGKPIMAKQLTLLQYSATLEAQDPKNHEHVDSYRLWANNVDAPQPVQLGSDKQRLSQILFSLDGVDFGLVQRMIKQALADTKIEEGKVQVIILTRDSDKKDPVWRVIVNGSRDNGVVEFSVSGQKLRTL